MSDIIQLLPDSVANQIAAGEVIQRPASVVKELMENSIDSGADKIRLILKDSGKALIQVIDNGCGMSETDARLSFERHATSKIRKADDLFNIRTKGFRGEALASIGAIAHVELKTKKVEDELGTQIVMEGSKIVTQEVCTCPNGTSFSVKNLFYNVPARRNFLKANTIEFRHIIDEFQRVALAHPDISFEFHSNDNQVYQLERGNLRQRVVALHSKSYNEKLVPIAEDTDIVKIQGYIGKPEFAKKLRGEQFFFVNNRFIKSNYLNHAISSAYSDLISKDQYPSYFLFLEVPSQKIDINIHPTKTEIKFEEEKAIYAIIRSATKKALGENNLVPTLDFSQEEAFEISLKPNRPIVEPPITINQNFNPFDNEASSISTTQSNSTFSSKPKINATNWESLYSVLEKESIEEFEQQTTILTEQESLSEKSPNAGIYQFHNRYIVTQVKSGIIIIDQQKAHERVLYERYLKSLVHNKEITQQQLFPFTVELSFGDFALLKELESEIKTLGFDIAEFGKNTVVVNGTPSGSNELNVMDILEGVINEYRQNTAELKLEKRESIARSMATNLAIKAGKKMNALEMESLIDQLFVCENPYYSPNGSPTIVTFTLEDLSKQFNK